MGFIQDHCRAVLAVNSRRANQQQVVFLLPDFGLFYWQSVLTVGAGKVLQLPQAKWASWSTTTKNCEITYAAVALFCERILAVYFFQ